MPRMPTSRLIVAVLFTLGVAAGVAYAAASSPPSQPNDALTAARFSLLNGAKTQAKTAAAHAGYAARGETVSFSKEHLGEALVCIEGAKGKNVNAAWENPCKGMGNGVLADLQRANADPALIAKAKSADTAAVTAMKSSDLVKIKASAKQVSTLMQQVAQAKYP